MVNSEGIPIKEKVTKTEKVGGIKRTLSGAKDGVVTLAEKTGLLDPSSSDNLKDPLKNPDNYNPDQKQSEVTEPLKNTDNHDKSFNSKSENSIPKNGESVKPSIAEQIDAQGKYEKTRAQMVEHNAKVNALNNGATTLQSSIIYI